MKIAFKDVSGWLGARLARPRKQRPTVDSPHAQRPTDIEPIEGSVQSALHPVETPRGFRETLRDNLQVAAQRRQTGLQVDYSRPVRQLVLLTVSLGVIVATITTVLLARRNQERSQS
jgi:hypothetical protein